MWGRCECEGGGSALGGESVKGGWVGRFVGLVVAAVLVAIVVVPAFALATVLLTARNQDATHTDTLVVLGAAQFWGHPSPVLEARLDHARVLYDGKVSAHIITVGGKQPHDKTTEGQAGKDWLIKAGVPAAAIRAVPVGSDTLNSLTAVAKVMAARGWTSATIVTDPTHQARSLAIARALGIDAHGAPTTEGSGSSVTIDYVIRETGGLLWFWLGQRWKTVQIVGVS